MKKIAFSTRYGLEQAVIDRVKDMTRREDKKLNHPLVTSISEWGVDDKGKAYVTITYSTGLTEDVYPAYQIGEEVAVAQSYRTLIESGYLADEREDGWVNEKYIVSAGFRNKMFVRADLMPHHIRITDIRVERLQDISDEDCMCEGVERWLDGYIVCGLMERSGRNNQVFATPREAFAALIDRISGRGTWQRNPWVFVYKFELIK